MDVDVVDILGGETSILQGISHHQLGSQPVGVSRRQVIGIGREPRTDELSVDMRTTC